jgi:hypothetical protein
LAEFWKDEQAFVIDFFSDHAGGHFICDAQKDHYNDCNRTQKSIDTEHQVYFVKSGEIGENSDEK